MKTVIRKLYIILFLLVVALNLFAQTSYFGLEYIENKGQWDKQVTFKSNLNGGAIFLRKTGFTYFSTIRKTSLRYQKALMGMVQLEKSS
jgi:hypothetical protein